MLTIRGLGDMNQKEKNGLILKHYGLNAQKLKLCEECAELIQAILKGKDTCIFDEIADVEVVLEQIVGNYGIEEFIEYRKAYKINRQLCRIRDEYIRRNESIPEWLEEALEEIREE